MACQCNNRVHDDYKENVLFGTLVLSNGELAQAQFWFPSEKNPSPNAGAPYSLKLNKLVGLGKTSYDIFHDDKFLVDSFSLDSTHTILTLIVGSNLLRFDGWELKKGSTDYSEPWIDFFGKSWTRDNFGRYYSKEGRMCGYKAQFIPRPCCSKTSLLTHCLCSK